MMRKKLHTKICSVALSAIMLISLFTGCSADSVQPSTSEVDSTPAVTTTTASSTTTTSITTTVSDNTTNPTPGATDANSDFSVKYKYWYDSDYTKESQPNPDTTAIESINTDKQLFGLEDLPIHTDENGMEYILSGRSLVYLENGKLPLTELVLLRTEEGQRVYTVEDRASTTKELEAFDSMLEANGIVPPTSIEERRVADETLTDEKTIPSDLDIYVNNLETGYTTNDDGMIDISNVFSKLTTLGYLDPFNKAAENTITVCMQTAAAQVDVEFAFTDNGVKVSYENETGVTLAADDIVKSENTILFTPDALERTLGYDVEVYADAGFINIVTDQQDLVVAETLVDSDTVDTYVNTPESNTKPDKPEPEKPTENTTPDGKYDLADTDMVNPDGTYTQTEFNPDTIPAWSSNNPFDEAKQQRFQDRGVTSNPSKIPYSEITLENAHEAFPFLGWLGYTPDYTMVLPTDSPDVIASKVYDNLIGKEPTSGHDLWKYYNFTSEAEYNVYLAEQQAAADAAEAKGQEAEAERADPNHKIGDVDTDLSFEEWWNS